MSPLLIEPHYLGSLEYYALLLQHEEVLFEVQDRFQKQTYRNRCLLLGANGIQVLTIPTKYSSQTIYKDVRIDHQQRWKKDHWGAFYSSYGKAPFFEYFADPIHQVWERRHDFLLDLTTDLLKLTFKMLQKDVKMTFTEVVKKKDEHDLRDLIIPKKPFSDRKIYFPAPYMQLFGDAFVPNLSVVDLLLNQGPQASAVLAASFLKPSVSTK